jgi:hypothetical protein
MVVTISVTLLYYLFLYPKSTATGVIFRFSTIKQKMKQNITGAWNIPGHVRYSAV